MGEIILKGIQKEITDLDESKGVVTAYANAFNNKDSHGDISMPGSFTKTVNEGMKKLRVLKNHDTRLKLGVPLEVDPANSYGLLTKTQFNMNKPLGRDTFTDIQLEVANGQQVDLSVGVQVIKRDAINKAKVTEYRLLEYSFLDFLGANPLAVVTDVKSLINMTPEQFVEQIATLTKQYNANYSDGRLKDIETALKTLDQLQPSAGTVNDEAVAAELKEWIANYQLKNYLQNGN